MAYDWCVDYEAHSATRNRAPTPLLFIDEIIQTYEKTYKVPREKLGVVFPWYACAFECAGEGAAYGAQPWAWTKSTLLLTLTKAFAVSVMHV